MDCFSRLLQSKQGGMVVFSPRPLAEYRWSGTFLILAIATRSARRSSAWRQPVSFSRIDPGLYNRPRINRLTGKPDAVDYRAVIEAIARRDQARILIDGMTAANDLGLSEAVPGRVLIHSDTRLKPLRLSNLTITFRPTSARKLYWAGRPAMRIVQALHWLRPKLDNPEESKRIRRQIEALLSDLNKAPHCVKIWSKDCQLCRSGCKIFSAICYPLSVLLGPNRSVATPASARKDPPHEPRLSRRDHRFQQR